MGKPRKKVLLVCGSGIVSCTLIAPVVEEILNETPYNCELIKGRFHDIPLHIKTLDLILTTVPLPKDVASGTVPVVVVTRLFGGAKEEVKQQILKALGD
ncbi:MAG: PTS sugar transporter subunit IIB [Candidatus Kryptoniota bacterium]